GFVVLKWWSDLLAELNKIQQKINNLKRNSFAFVESKHYFSNYLRLYYDVLDWC
ncbi:20679_t:CDS:2, partial [Entrophospora sp. SA101]